jgi:[histone H3]-lysine36 N-trimethyltransferase
MNKYKHKIPKEDLKRFAKEIAKKLVASDYKAGRVKDPTKIDEKQQKKVKDFCKQFFDKAAYKHKKHEEEKTARRDKKGSKAAETPTAMSPESQDTPALSMKKEESDIEMSDHDEPTPNPDETPSDSRALKRKRGSSSPVAHVKTEDDGAKSPFKKLVAEATGNGHVDAAEPPPPPPPPAPMETPPASTPREDADGMEIEADLHDEGDVMFRDKSMADVKALAQAGGDEEEEFVGEDGMRV